VSNTALMICRASFFAPFRRDVEPYIRLATGDYPALKKSRGRDRALAAFLCSLAHEIVHYEQWLAGDDLSERKAVRKSLRLVELYNRDVDHP